MIYDRLRAAGIPVWDCRVPGYKNLTYRPQYTLIHHTAAGGTADFPSLNVCKYGRDDLPGPLCQILIGRSGTVCSITDGYANHAGRVVEPYSNYSLVGIELENNGVGEPYGEAQLAATRAVCHALGFPVVLGHKEICVPTGRKIDPSFDMGAFRASLTVPPEDDMTPDEIRYGHLSDNSTINDRLLWTNAQADKAVKEQLPAVLTELAALRAEVAALKAGAGAVDVNALATAVADKLAARLAS